VAEDAKLPAPDAPGRRTSMQAAQCYSRTKRPVGRPKLRRCTLPIRGRSGVDRVNTAPVPCRCQRAESVGERTVLHRNVV
jgi:hypothetical protein